VINIPTIPTDFTPQSANSNYFKATVGDHRVRILSGAITGYSWWTEENDGSKKPHRVPIDQNPPVEFADSVRKFMALPIFNYELSRVQIWEITQSSIQQELIKLEKDPDWGSLIDYDLSVSRTGNDKLNTKYRVSPKPKTEMSKEVQSAAEKLPDLGALFEGKDPFATQDVDEKDLPM